MSIAQKLYENGKITYMRTDSVMISKDYQDLIKRHIENRYDTENYKYYKASKRKVSIKGAQEAHECIRTTKVDDILNDKYTSDDHRLYNLIKKRTIISQMKEAEYDVLVIYLENKELDGYFRSIEKALKFDGYLRYMREEFQEENLKEIREKDIYEVKKCTSENKSSKNKLYYNEASLVKKLERSGIGRPSTYASIIETLYNRRYTETKSMEDKEEKIQIIEFNRNKIEEREIQRVRKGQKRCIQMTELGEKVLNYLLENFSGIINEDFTSQVERDLDRIMDGDIDWIEVIRKVYNSFIGDVKIQMSIEGKKKNNKYESFLVGVKNKKEVIIQNGPYGPYISYDKKNINLKYLLEKVEKDYKELTLEDIDDLLVYPMKLGSYKKKQMVIMKGPYGKYLKYNNKNYRIPQRNEYKKDECIEYIRE